MNASLPDPSTIERAGLKAWPGLEVEWDGSWVRRASNGYTKRANSVQCHDPADEDDASRRLEQAGAWFRDRGLPPVFRVNPLTGPRVVAALDEAGWSAHDRSLVLAKVLEPMEADPRVQMLSPLDPAFLAAQAQFQGYDRTRADKLAALLGSLQVPAVGALLIEEGRAVASALFDVADGIVFAGNVVTDPAARRKGHGRALMRAGLAWGHGQGARAASHNVQADNGPALALYYSLGYRPHYDYVYRTRGAA